MPETKRQTPLWRSACFDEHGQRLLDDDGRPLPWPTMPAKPKWRARRQTRNPPRLGAYVDSGASPIEVLSRMAGGTTFKTPSVGRSTRGQVIGPDDIAHALGWVRDPLAACLALAFACQTVKEWPRVQELAYPRLLAILRANNNTRSIVSEHRRHRVRLVLHHVFHDMAMLRQQRDAKDVATSLRMRPRDYRALYTRIAGELETAAAEGAYTACRVLFGRESDCV